MILRQKLNDYCRNVPADDEAAFDACWALGPFARWWLRSSVRRRARRFDSAWPTLTGRGHPQRDPAPGACAPILARRPGWKCLKRAFLLPVVWRPGSTHKGIPEELRRIADRILKQFKVEGWGLAPAPAGWSSQFSIGDDLGLKFESAWATLSGALLLAKMDLGARTDVWASACWSPERRLWPVNTATLPAKMQLAQRLGVRKFFVAPSQHAEAQPYATADLQVLALNASDDPRRALEPYLAALGEPPHVATAASNRDEQFEIGVNYYSLLPFRSEQQRHYYFQELMPVICRRMQGAIESMHQGRSRRPTAMIAVVSDGWELILLLASALKIEHVLLLHTSDQTYKKNAELVVEKLAEGGLARDRIRRRTFELRRKLPDGSIVPLQMRELQNSLVSVLSEFAAQVGAENLVIDLTLGTALMTLVLESIARSQFPAAQLIYVSHATPDGRVRPGAEAPLIWSPT